MTVQVCTTQLPSVSVGLAFAPNGRSPSVSLQHQSMPGTSAADGLFNIVSVAFPGGLSILFNLLRIILIGKTLF